MNKKEQNVEVVVVGGGISGIAAAVALQEEGFQVVLLEARQRLGGRVCTVQGETGGSLELGAQWIHGGSEENSVWREVKKVGLLGDVDDDEVGNVVHPCGDKVDMDLAKRAWQIYQQVNEEVEGLYTLEEEDKSNVTLSQFCKKRVSELAGDDLEKLEPIVSSLLTVMAEYACDDLSQVSAKLYGSSRELDGGDITVPSGLCAFLDILADRLKKDTVMLEEEVVGIQWNEDGCLITSKTGTVLRCQHALITIPLGVLQANHTSLFRPNLGGQVLEALASLGPGSLSKVFLGWDAPWWEEGEGSVRIARSSKEREDANLPEDWSQHIPGFAEVDGKSGELLFWVVGPAAKVVDSLSDEEVAQGATTLLQKVHRNKNITNASRVTRHPWTNDPFTLGAYSYPRYGAKEGVQAILASPLPSKDCPRLLLAGEHASPEFWSFLHGAYDSGIAQARKIIAWRKIIT